MIELAVAALLQGPFAPIDSAFDRIRRGPASPAVGIAVVHRGSVVYTNVVGYSDLERQVRAGPSTRFDWASIAKQFTAHAVSQLVERKRLATSDTARRYIPDLDLAGASITIDQLLHHTSGLEDTDGLFALAGGRSGDVVTHEDLVRLLVRQQHLKFAPGSAHAYSNGGYSLLAEIVARVTGRSFAAWTDSAVFGALGMRSSGFLASPSQIVPDRALPYTRERTIGYRLSTSDLYPGAGGLFASMPDMARWLQHLLEPAAERGAALRLRERGVLTTGDTIEYAWGIGRTLYRGRVAYQHGGSGPATASHLFIIPELEFGVVAAIAGDTEVNPATIAYQAADLLLGAQLAPRDTVQRGPRMTMLTTEMLNTRPVESQGVSVRAALLASYAGTYALSDGTTLMVRARGDTLDVAFGGRLPYIPLFPLPDGRFVMVPLWDAYRFELPASGPATHIVRERMPKSMRDREGPPLRGERRAERVVTPATSAPFVGTYYSDELDTFYRVELADGKLRLVHARHGALPMLETGDQQFAVQGGGIAAARFARGGDRMIGMELEAVSWGTRASFRRVASPP